MSDNNKKSTPSDSASKSRVGKDFIPFSTSPNNWPFFGARSNPLSSKGESAHSADYDHYQQQSGEDETKGSDVPPYK